MKKFSIRLNFFFGFGKQGIGIFKSEKKRKKDFENFSNFKFHKFIVYKTI